MRYYLRSEIAKLADINSETLRFYENIQLIPTPERASNGYRQYQEYTLIQLELIKIAKKTGFTLNEIKELFNSAKSIDDIVKVVNEKTIEINNKIKILNDSRKTLVEFNKEIQTKICPNLEVFLNKEK